MRKINNLQVLRAFAALNVALFHILGTSIAYGFEPNYLKPLVGWGYNGVDIFFVLSGFIMAYILSNRIISPQEFFLARLLRVAPLYWSLTGFFLLLSWAVPSAFRGDNSFIIKHSIASFFFISQPWLGKSPLLFDGWSLEYEMLFYLFLSLGLFFSRKYLTYVVSIIAITFAVRFFDLDSVAYEFIFGVLLGIIYTNFGNNYLLQICSLVLGVALFFSTLVGNPIILAEGSRALIFGAPAFLLIYGLIGLTQIKAGVLTVLGDASYSIYLIQVFTIPAFYKVASSFEAFSHFSSDLLALLCLIFTALGGVLTYFLLERNFANVFSKRIK